MLIRFGRFIHREDDFSDIGLVRVCCLIVLGIYVCIQKEIKYWAGRMKRENETPKIIICMSGILFEML